MHVERQGGRVGEDDGRLRRGLINKTRELWTLTYADTQCFGGCSRLKGRKSAGFHIKGLAVSLILTVTLC